MARIPMLLAALLIAGCQTVTEVELTPAPVTNAVIANFLALPEAPRFAPLFQQREGHADIRVMDGALYAFTTLADDDLSTAQELCTALMASARLPYGQVVPTASVIGASDRTLATCRN